jgi:hypothetical protein
MDARGRALKGQLLRGRLGVFGVAPVGASSMSSGWVLLLFLLVVVVWSPCQERIGAERL